jgi:hypothetical protein
LKSIYNVLRKNGQTAITSWKSQGHWDYLHRAARIILRDKTYPPPKHFDVKWLSGEYIANLLVQAGFWYVVFLVEFIELAMSKFMNVNTCGNGLQKKRS